MGWLYVIPHDGRISLTNNAAERALRGFALGRKSWLFAGSDRGAERAAFMATLIISAKLNDIDPQAWLADVLANWTAPRTRACVSATSHLSGTLHPRPRHSETGNIGLLAIRASTALVSRMGS